MNGQNGFRRAWRAAASGAAAAAFALSLGALPSTAEEPRPAGETAPATSAKPEGETAPAASASPAPPASPGASGPTEAAAPLRDIAHRSVRLSGKMPFLEPDGPAEMTFEAEFTLYTSPVGGRPLWSERRKVTSRASMVEVRLGEVVPMPEEAMTATFRFIGFRFGDGPEVTPRYPIESLVWASATGDGGYARLPPASAIAQGDPPLAPSGAGGVLLETNPRPPLAWIEAARAAERAGRRLPTLEEWLAARAAGERAGFRETDGHYEWVQAFVYAVQSHTPGIASYRGKPNGCSGEELSPTLNRYHFRCARERAAAAAAPSGPLAPPAPPVPPAPPAPSGR
jgi:hypothetical protein